METGYRGGLSLKYKGVYFEVVRDGKGRMRSWTSYLYKSGRVSRGMAKTFIIIFLPYFLSGWSVKLG